MATTKRKEPPSGGARSSPKRARVEIPAYHLTPSVKEPDGTVQWPAPRAQIERARHIILECALSPKPLLIVPDKDADGLSAGAILRRTLLLMGVAPERIHVHLLSKGQTVHSASERTQMAAFAASYVFVLDQGSRAGPRLIDDEDVTTLIIDHHQASADDFPCGAAYVTACSSPPVATSALLTYELCKPLHADVAAECAWLCIVGTHGDLGTAVQWAAPFPDMRDALRRHTRKALNEAVSLVNAPRRTADFDVAVAWAALSAATAEPGPAAVLADPRLREARRQVNAEVERCTHAAPKFARDGRVAVFRIHSPAQVHPVIATRWAGHLSSKALEIVLVANDGYLPGKVNFSCRIARCARARDPPVDIIRSLKAYASRTEPDADEAAETGSGRKVPLLERLGEDFARGHVRASGGIVGVDEFEELMRLMEIGVKPASKDDGPSASSSPSKARTTSAAANLPGQKNTLMSYFSTKPGSRG